MRIAKLPMPEKELERERDQLKSDLKTTETTTKLAVSEAIKKITEERDSFKTNFEKAQYEKVISENSLKKNTKCRSRIEMMLSSV